MQLSAEGTRVIGSLIEKQLTTPDQYPLTVKALTAACNQTSNREPVVDYDEQTVMSALNTLKEGRLVRFVLPSHGRSAVRYRHILDETLALDKRQCAVVAVLFLRGPQTVGEVRARTERMATFDGLDEVEHELLFLSTRSEPLTQNLGRRPGQKEERWMTPLAGPSHEAGWPSLPVAPDEPGDGVAGPPPAGDDVDLRAEVASLRAEVHQLARDLAALRASLGE